MPKFAYAAIDANGTSVEGVTKADTIGAARTMLVEQNLFPVKSGAGCSTSSSPRRR
jgi:type IV pilus assembly protein PilC